MFQQHNYKDTSDRVQKCLFDLLLMSFNEFLRPVVMSLDKFNQGTLEAILMLGYLSANYIDKEVVKGFKALNYFLIEALGPYKANVLEEL